MYMVGWGCISQRKKLRHVYMQIWAVELEVGGLGDIIVSYEVGKVSVGGDTPCSA